MTEQGGLLEAAHDVAARIANAESKLAETKDTPSGHLRVNTTVGFGTVWLTTHLKEFMELYPDITVSLLVIDTELDLSMREADVAIRLHAAAPAGSRATTADDGAHPSVCGARISRRRAAPRRAGRSRSASPRGVRRVRYPRRCRA